MDTDTIGRRAFLQRFGALAAGTQVVSEAAAAPATAGATTDKPNIIYLHSHDTGRYIQPYGYAVPAPHLQKLASRACCFGARLVRHPRARRAARRC